MAWLNYHHLLYFWVVAKHGSVTRASKELRLAQQTIGAQIHQLEEVLGHKLFERRGRNLVLSESGKIAFRYADEIFALGQEFQNTLHGGSSGAPMRLTVGVSDALAKSVVYRMLEPAFGLDRSVAVICREHRSAEAFMGELASHAIDVILSDAPAGPGSPVRAFSHLLGECGSTFFAAPALAKACRRGFPRALDGQPFVLPAADSTSRRALNEWFDSVNIRPKIVAELDDAALATIFGEAGLGIFATPDVIEKEVQQRYKVHVVGRTQDVRHRFYVISLERKIRHAAVLAMCDAARRHIFA